MVHQVALQVLRLRAEGREVNKTQTGAMVDAEEAGETVFQLAALAFHRKDLRAETVQVARPLAPQEEAAHRQLVQTLSARQVEMVVQGLVPQHLQAELLPQPMRAEAGEEAQRQEPARMEAEMGQTQARQVRARQDAVQVEAGQTQEHQVQAVAALFI
jgi:hypothetical protein